MSHFLLVGTGGFIGAALRYAVSGSVQTRFPLQDFPAGTLAVNIIGCLLLGAGMELSESRHFMTPEVRLLLFVGLLGGFTTFSTFGYETLAVLRSSIWVAMVNIGLHVGAGLAAVWTGAGLARAL